MANRTVANLTAVLQMNNTKFKKGVKGSETALKRFQKQVGKVGGALAAAFGTRAILKFTKASIAALDVQLKAEASLLVALDGRVLVQQRLIKQAGKLQKMTLFGDEETIRAQALIAAFVDEEEAIKRVIPLVQDFAAAKSVQLSVAADLVSKTLGSSTNALTRYGIAVEGQVGSVERLDSVIDGLSKAFGGQAVAAAEADVALTQLSNTWGDFQEAFARNINTGKGLLPWLTRGAKGGLEDLITLLDDTDNSAVTKFAQFFSGIEGLPLDDQIAAMESRIKSLQGSMEFYAKKYQRYDKLASESRGKEKKSFEESQDFIMEIQTSNLALLRVYESQLKAIRAMATAQGEIEVPTPAAPRSAFGGTGGMDALGLQGFFGADDATGPFDNSAMLESVAWLQDMDRWARISNEQLDNLEDELEDIMDDAETLSAIKPFEGWAKETVRLKGELINVEEALSTVGFMVGTMLANQFTELGHAIGESMRGAEDSFTRLGKIILENIGNILILVGLKTKQWYLVAAGAAIQLGIGLSEGLSVPESAGALVGISPTVTFEISGQDLQATSDMNAGLRHIAT